MMMIERNPSIITVRTVSLYKIRYSPNVGDLSESAFDASPTPVLAADISDGSLQPLQAGIKQNVTFLLRNATQDVTYFIALKAVDKVSKQSPVSNVISVKMARIPAERRYVLVADVSSLMNNFVGRITKEKDVYIMVTVSLLYVHIGRIESTKCESLPVVGSSTTFPTTVL